MVTGMLAQVPAVTVASFYLAREGSLYCQVKGDGKPSQPGTSRKPLSTLNLCIAEDSSWDRS